MRTRVPVKAAVRGQIVRYQKNRNVWDKFGIKQGGWVTLCSAADGLEVVAGEKIVGYYRKYRSVSKESGIGFDAVN
ncbi:hypothetical protein J6590_032285 [Homalodisca vitripennis]|nr:hypothetical protein J6590_032285 [Homalodisca vitripennis]